MIPYGRHYLDDADIGAVVDVLRNGALTQGPKVLEFEGVIAEFTGAKYAVAVSSGTAALHLACMAADVGAGDEVVTSANTFVASANCALYVGADPVIVDIDQQTLNLDLDLLAEVCNRSRKVKAAIPVHFAGSPCDMQRVKEVVDPYDLVVIEDASHALGATYQDGSRVGNCRYSDMTVFSFHPVKGIASGEGGMITTNDYALYSRLLQLRSHGICKGNFDIPGIGATDNNLKYPEEGIEDGDLKMWYYEMQQLGFNYRITDIQSALAISQMNKIDSFLNRRRELVLNYDAAFKDIDLIECTQLPGRYTSSHHIYVILIDFEHLGISRHNFMKEMGRKGVGSQVHYIPVPMQPYYRSLGFNIGDFPVSKEYYDRVLSIPLYYHLSDEDQRHVIETIIDILDSTNNCNIP